MNASPLAPFPWSRRSNPTERRAEEGGLLRNLLSIAHQLWIQFELQSWNALRASFINQDVLRGPDLNGADRLWKARVLVRRGRRNRSSERVVEGDHAFQTTR